MTRLFEAKPFIIAEVGSNWTSFEDCKNSIQMAKQIGADAVKFQSFTYEALYGTKYPGVEGNMPYSLPLEWLPKLKSKAEACGIEFMCTAFSPELLEAINPFVEVHKIASSNLTDPFLLEAVKRTNKPILLSTGASSVGDITRALEFLEDARNRTVLMYCNSSYPSRFHNLDYMRLMRERFHLPIAYSDHSCDVVWAPLSSVIHYGAIAIEKHFTCIPDIKTPDRPHSLNPFEFKAMVDAIRKHDQISFNPTVEEKEMFLRYKVRLLATQDLNPGDVLDYGKNYGIFRSLKDDQDGLIGFAWSAINGKVLKVKVHKGDGIAGRFVEP